MNEQFRFDFQNEDFWIFENNTQEGFVESFNESFDFSFEPILELHRPRLEKIADEKLEEYKSIFSDRIMSEEYLHNVWKGFFSEQVDILRSQYMSQYVVSHLGTELSEMYKENPESVDELINGISDNVGTIIFKETGRGMANFRMYGLETFPNETKVATATTTNGDEYLFVFTKDFGYKKFELPNNTDHLNISYINEKPNEKLDFILKSIISIFLNSSYDKGVLELFKLLKSIGLQDVLYNIDYISSGGVVVSFEKIEDGNEIVVLYYGDLVGYLKFDNDYNLLENSFDREEEIEQYPEQQIDEDQIEENLELRRQQLLEEISGRNTNIELTFSYDEVNELINKLQSGTEGIDFVIDFMIDKRKQLYLTEMKDSLDCAYEIGFPYFPYMDFFAVEHIKNQFLETYGNENLSEHGLPEEYTRGISLLSIPESHWSGHYSWVGAAGPLQIMESTGRKFGLIMEGEITKRVPLGASGKMLPRNFYVIDQRRDPLRSAELFGWHLVDTERRGRTDTLNFDLSLRLAMYNGGFVNRYIKAGGSDEFTFHGFLSYLGRLLMSKKAQLEASGESVDVDEEYEDIIRFIRENFEYPFKFYAVHELISEGYVKDTGLEDYSFERVVITDETTDKLIHIVELGQNPRTIAKQYGVNVNDVLAINGMTKDEYVVEGQKLEIPRKNGLTLNLISSKLGIDLSLLLKLNPAISVEGIDFNLNGLDGIYIYLPVGFGSKFYEIFGEGDTRIVDINSVYLFDGGTITTQ